MTGDSSCPASVWKSWNHAFTFTKCISCERLCINLVLGPEPSLWYSWIARGSCGDIGNDGDYWDTDFGNQKRFIIQRRFLVVKCKKKYFFNPDHSLNEWLWTNGVLFERFGGWFVSERSCLRAERCVSCILRGIKIDKTVLWECEDNFAAENVETLGLNPKPSTRHKLESHKKTELWVRLLRHLVPPPTTVWIQNWWWLAALWRCHFRVPDWRIKDRVEGSYQHVHSYVFSKSYRYLLTHRLWYSPVLLRIQLVWRYCWWK